MDFDTWMLTKLPRYNPRDDSPLLRYLRECWKAATAQQEAELGRLTDAFVEQAIALGELRDAIEAMRVAGGAKECQTAFDPAKGLLK